MALLLRLLLVFCLVAPAAPDVAARPHAASDEVTTQATEDALPPCHEPAEGSRAAAAPGDPNCCDGLDAGCGCGCLHAAGLPVGWLRIPSPAPSDSPASTVGPEAPSPPPTRAERPPIA